MSLVPVSVAIVHHPSRSDLLEGMLARLGGVFDVSVCTDEGQGPIENTRGAWANYHPRAEWHLVMEDDLLLCKNFARTLKAALVHVPDPVGAVSLFGISKRYLNAFNDGYAWYVDNGTNWAQALLFPTQLIPQFIAWEMAFVPATHRWFCQRLTAYCQARGMPVNYPLPMLVDHLGADRSLVGNPVKAGGTHERRASCFLMGPPANPDYWKGRALWKKNHAQLRPELLT